MLYKDKCAFRSAKVNDIAVRFAYRQTRFQICVLPFNGYITLGHSLNPSELQFPNLQ